VGLLVGASQLSLAAELNTPAATADMIVTVESSDSVPAGNLRPGVLKIYQGESQRTVMGVERLSGERASMELFIYLDDSIDSATLEAIRPDLEEFIMELPETTKVAIGHSLTTQGFTDDLEKAVNSLKQPAPVTERAGTYSEMLDLMRQWPSNEQAYRRMVLIITAGENDENQGASSDGPFAEAARRNAQIAGIAINSIVENKGQANLLALSNATGGHSYRSGDAGSLRPFLDDFSVRLANQYRITFEPKNYAGTQPVRVQTDSPGVTITAPTGIYIRQRMLTASLQSGPAGEQQLAQVIPELR
jgi:hypothetical protein